MSSNFPRKLRNSAKRTLFVIALTSLAGCATFSKDGGFGSVEQTTQERLGKEVKWARSDKERATLQGRVSELLAKPLAVDDAIQLALFNNRGLQASFFDLGISEADLVPVSYTHLTLPTSDLV